MILTGTYERNLDAKGRLSLPAPVRKDLCEHVYVLPALETDALYVFSEEAFEKYVLGLFEKRGGYDDRKEDDQKLMRRLTSMAVLTDVDSASRIGLSEQLRAKKHLDREVTVVGNFNHLEIWDRATWDAMQAEQTDEDLASIFFGSD